MRSLDLAIEKQIDSMYAKIQMKGDLRYTKIVVGFIPPTKLFNKYMHKTLIPFKYTFVLSVHGGGGVWIKIKCTV